MLDREIRMSAESHRLAPADVKGRESNSAANSKGLFYRTALTRELLSGLCSQPFFLDRSS